MSDWRKPETNSDSFVTGLRVRNSLAAKQTVEFVPIDGRKVNWYICGPTVYSDSHLGHAKTYLCFDIIRKILARHFRYEVHQVMNITNIDDKIIKASAELGVDYFDFAFQWERDFFEVMNALGVDLPDKITRVSEFVPEIVAFTERLIERGVAYASNGSVYFDIEAFKRAGHQYPKLRPCAADCAAADEPTEEEPGFAGDKRFKGDFALWKRSREGEPAWDSPWGRGRPGWHIECSAMCASALPTPLDLHSGGDDLMFPHHSNELAQSEAFYDIPQWVNYFTHTGRMNINGQKMSKSLKNFIKIREVLETTPARVLRLFYALTRYNDTLNIDLDARFGMARSVDARFANFFQATAARARGESEALARSQKFDAVDTALETRLLAFPAAVHEAFCDDFNTKEVLSLAQSLVSALNQYIESAAPKLVLLKMGEERLRVALTAMGLNYDYVGASGGEALIDELVRFRHEIKAAVRAGDAAAALSLCDRLRDERLPRLGVRLEDGPTLQWKPCEPGEEAARREHIAQTRVGSKDAGDVADLWKGTKYAKHVLDEKGIPIADSKGNAISAKDRKYCEKKVCEFLAKNAI